MRNHRRSLFEVMNKTPEAQNPVTRSRPLFFWRAKKKEPTGFVPMVAEPLTEEEARAELAARQAALEEAERARREKLQAKLARKAARKAEREAARRLAAELALAKRGSEEAEPMIRFAPGRVLLSLSTTASIIAGALGCIGLVGAYAAGVRSGSTGKAEMAKVAAINGSASEAGPVRNAAVTPGGPTGGPTVHRKAPISPPARAGTPAADVQANAPMMIDSQPPAVADDPSNYNYLEIQWFEISRDKNATTLLAELQDIQKFLSERGVETYARKHPRGYLLFSAHGIPASPEFQKQREDFRRRVAGYGRDYRKQGGLYDWKDCYFVSYNRAVSGQPI